MTAQLVAGLWVATALWGLAGGNLVAAPKAEVSWAMRAMRPLPEVAPRDDLSLVEGAGTWAKFADPTHGDDANPGTRDAPWKTLAFALRQLEPGDTLFLRGGIWFEKIALTRSGTEQRPVTIRSYPGELAVIDGGLREFHEQPAQAWRPLTTGAPGEFVSTRSFLEADARRAPAQFLPAAWEPMWGIEDQRPLALGHFADSMVPLHSYRTWTDLRATDEVFRGKAEARRTGVYCGPGLWFNRRTGRIHIRLAHQQLPGLGDRAWTGETDPRRLKLSIAVGFGEEVLRATGVRHVRLRHLAFRGATGSPMIHVYGSQHLEFDHVTVFGGFPALLINASQHIRVAHCAFRGLAAPWSSRAHMKYLGTPSYQIVLRNDQPRNADIEFAWCEFTDDHDFAFLRYARNLRMHHCFIDNFNDDGLECGPKLRDHTIFIYQNRIGRCLIPLTQHEIEPDESPADHDPGSGVFVYRNVFDMRGGTYRAPPPEPDPTGDFQHVEGHLAGDHGSPIWPVMRVYHNTFLRATPVFRGYYLFGLGAQGMRQNERDVFNNIFVRTRGPAPGLTITTRSAYLLREGGNLLWSVEGDAQQANARFRNFRASPLFDASRAVYPPGWTASDHYADPRFMRLNVDPHLPSDLRLQADSPAVDAGQSLPPSWPDPLRDQDASDPDSGAVPLGVDGWRIGVDGRLTVFGG